MNSFDDTRQRIIDKCEQTNNTRVLQNVIKCSEHVMNKVVDTTWTLYLSFIINKIIIIVSFLILKFSDVMFSLEIF